MSVWTTVEGTLVIPKKAHFSVKKWLQEHIDEFSYKEVDKIGEKITFRLSICQDGLWAAETINKFVTALPKNTYCDITSEIRWLK